ncbi:hypothetical protein C1645_842135 [Glomus cerebriforme]|uniref:F-box domain-containing protein n=1 Tax=Glomus cerebriforme TaxID=658196 RepID=A0A397S3E3_9GLOM|nr:hypothetical protein C1645_842135 [Glomus cerebriforme]
MSCRLSVECLTEIFEFLEKDKVTLHSCLLVNRLWCRVSVEILWRNIWNAISPSSRLSRLRISSISSRILSTLVACLPNESRDFLLMNGVFISNSKSPLFNYPSFCKVLSISVLINDNFYKEFFETQNSITSINSRDRNYMVAQELLKMFMKKISSLKKLTDEKIIYYYHDDNDNNFDYGKMTNFLNSFEARDCLQNLSELRCSSNLDPDFCYQLSQICKNIKSITIEFKYSILHGISHLIFSQNGLKSLTFIQHSYYNYSSNYQIIQDILTKHSNTLTKLDLNGEWPLSILTKFPNLQVLSLSFSDGLDLKTLQFVSLLQLRILNMKLGYFKTESITFLIKFLENNGKNLKEFYINICNNSINSAIAEFCPNLRSLYTQFDKGDSLKEILKDVNNWKALKFYVVMIMIHLLDIWEEMKC